MKTRASIATAAAMALVCVLEATPAQAQQSRNGYYIAPSPYLQHAPQAQGPVWVPGHWEWNGHRHAWVNGFYLQPQPGSGQSYGYARRHRDQDGDGIPNRFDRDRDGDGVPNRHDRQPANPWRR